MTQGPPNADDASVCDENAPPAAAHKRARKSERGYRTQLAKLFKKRVPDGVTLSSKGLEVLDALAQDIELRFAQRAAKLLALNRVSTLKSKHVMAAVGISLPPNLGAAAAGHGTTAFARFGGKAA